MPFSRILTQFVLPALARLQIDSRKSRFEFFRRENACGNELAERASGVASRSKSQAHEEPTNFAN